MLDKKIIKGVVGRVGAAFKLSIIPPYTKYKIQNTKALRFSVLSIASVLLIAPFASVAGEQLTSPNYMLDPNVANSFGGFSETGSYQLLDSGGEAAIGIGQSGSYKLSSGYIAQLEQSIELNVLPEGLVGYWPLNTGTGIQAYDVTPNDNHGVMEGEPEWISGIVGEGSLRFDGSNGVRVIHDNQHLLNDGLTISAWIRHDIPSESTDNRRILEKADNTASANGYRFVAKGDGSLQTRIDSDTTVDTPSGVIARNQWHHVVLTVETDGSVVFYVDGAEVGSGSSGSLSGINTTNDMTIAERTVTPNTSTRFIGDIDEVKVHGRVLSEDEVLDEYVANQQGIANALTLPRIGSSQSQTVGAEAVVLTDAPGYELALSQDGNLRTEQGEEIPQVSGSIMFPEQWIEGDTTGFGFTITDAIDRDGKWGSAPNFEYAAVPDTISTFYSRTGLSGGAKEVTNLQFRLGVDGAQAAGVYTNRLGFTATMKP